MNSVLEEIYRSGMCVDLHGVERQVTGGVSQDHARILQDMIRLTRAQTTLETGVAFGLSTLAICEVLQEIGANDARHYGIDPDQHAVHGGAAIESLRRARLDHLFELCEGPSHLMLPRLLEKGVALDLAFIDGWHTFDYTLLDFFYIDKMLRPGGCLVLHDYCWPSKVKATGFIMTHRKYKILPVREIPGPSHKQRLKGLLLGLYRWLRGTPREVICSHLIYQPRIACFQKTENFEPDHHFFRTF